MKNIESTIVELGGIFSQLAHMVKEQEEMVQRYVSHLAFYTYSAINALSLQLDTAISCSGSFLPRKSSHPLESVIMSYIPRLSTSLNQPDITCPTLS